MATTLYLQSANTPPATPAFNAGWTDTTQATRYPSDSVKHSTSISTVSISDGSNAQVDVLIGQWQTPFLRAGQTITGAQTISIQARFSETNAGNNLFMAWGVYVFNATTLQKTVITKRNDGTEVATSLTNRTDSTTSVAGNYTTVAGDYLVIEIGLEGDPTGSNNHNGSMSIGDNAAADLPSDDTTTTANNPNLILNDTLNFDRNFAVSESSSITDTPTLSKTNYINVSDSTIVTDIAGRKDDTAFVFDIPTLTVVTSAGFQPNVSDSTTVSDSPTLSLTSYINVSDSTAVSDSPTLNLKSYINVSDSTAVTDTPTIRIGPIFFDATSSSPYEASLSTYNWSHTVGSGSYGMLIIGVGIMAAGTVSSITAGGQSAVFLRADSNSVYRSELWYVKTPDVGAQTITVNLSASLTSIAGAVSYFGVDQIVSFEGTTGANGLGGSNTVNVTTVDNYDTIIDVTSTATASIAVGSGQVQRVNTSGALGSLGIGDRQWVTPSTVAANWTGTGVLDSWAITAVGLIPIGALVEPSVSDSTVVSDTVTLSLTSYINVSDSTDIGEAISMAGIDVISVSESTAITDTPTLSLVSYINVSDSSTISDSPTLSLTSPINVSDSSIVTDTPTLSLTSYISVTDSTSVSDTPTLSLTNNISVSDTTTVSDTVTLSLTSNINVSDTTAITDTPTLSLLSSINVSDTTTVTDIITMSGTGYLSVTDSTIVSDTPTLSLTSYINVSDASAVSDTITTAGIEYISVTDSTTVTDTPTVYITTLYISVSDSTTINEAILFAGQNQISVIDSTTVSDTPTIFIPILTIILEDSTEISDSPTISSGSVTLSVTDSITVTDFAGKPDDIAFIFENVSLEVINEVTASDSTAINEAVTLVLIGSTSTGYSFVVFID